MLKASDFKEHYKIPFENVDFKWAASCNTDNQPPFVWEEMSFRGSTISQYQPTYTDICTAHQILSLIWVEIVLPEPN